jgi:tRNA-specific 2-thiouridylase
LPRASGAEVIGVTLQLYDHGAATGRKGACCAGDDIRDARSRGRPAGHRALCDRSRKRASASEVVERFADEYLAGRTPIPCIRCNMGPKFTDLFAMARELGADCLATGHYVRRVVPGGSGAELHRALDPARDQSYFLYGTTEAQLDFLRFPLGGLPKQRVRAIAEAKGLRVAAKPDSQDICFVPDGDYASVVRSVRPEGARRARSFMRHHRRRCWGRIAASSIIPSASAAGWRSAVSPSRFTSPVLMRRDAACWSVRALLAVSAARIVETNRIGPLPDGPLTAKVRSLAKPVPVTLEGSLRRWRRRHDPLRPARIRRRARTGGSLYAGERVVGGGWIDSTEGV